MDQDYRVRKNSLRAKPSSLGKRITSVDEFDQLVIIGIRTPFVLHLILLSVLCCSWIVSISVSPMFGQPISEAEEKRTYVNKEREKGAVNAPVPPHFKDLSKAHKPLGCLCEEIKVKQRW